MPSRKQSSDEADALIAAEAAERFARSLNGKLSKADKRSLDLWLAEDPRHAKAYADVERLFHGAGELPQIKSRKPAARKITRRDAGKAIVLLAAAAGGWRYLSGHPFADFRTGSGERRTLTLADGSRAELAAETRMSVAIDATRRAITLHDGEAFFQVASDSRPFSVAAGEGVTTALGTAFSVEYRNGAARVLVTEHAVNVRLGAQSAGVASGRQVQYEGGHVGATQAADIETELAWRSGQLVFTAVPLGEVVETINRWRKGRLVVLSPALMARPITLIADIERLDTLPDQLARVLPVRSIQITPLLTLLIPA